MEVHHLQKNSLKSRGLGQHSWQSWVGGSGNAGNLGLGRGRKSSCSEGGGQAGEPVSMHRKEENSKGSPQAHPREKLRERDAREETSCQSPVEWGKTESAASWKPETSRAISRKRQLPGSRVEQGQEARGHLSSLEGLVLTFPH